MEIIPGGGSARLDLEQPRPVRDRARIEIPPSGRALQRNVQRAHSNIIAPHIAINVVLVRLSAVASFAAGRDDLQDEETGHRRFS
ncbi:MAG TPA: hypothetical protein VGD37_10310 [Kofleriaceae bacterium]